MVPGKFVCYLAFEDSDNVGKCLLPLGCRMGLASSTEVALAQASPAEDIDHHSFRPKEIQQSGFSALPDPFVEGVRSLLGDAR